MPGACRVKSAALPVTVPATRRHSAEGSAGHYVGTPDFHLVKTAAAGIDRQTRHPAGTPPPCRHGDTGRPNLTPAGATRDAGGMDTTTNAAEAGRLTRAQVAKALGISVAGVRRREGASLHPELGPKGEHLFAPAEVEAVREGLGGQPEAPEAEPALEAPADPASAEPPPAMVPAASGPPTTAACVDTSGEMAATAFALFEAGKSPAQVVIETKMGPETVERLYETWVRLGAKDTTSTAAQSRIDEVAGYVEGLRAQVAILRGSHRNDDVARLANQVQDLEAQLEHVAQDAEVAQIRDGVNGLMGNILELNGRLATAEQRLAWCLQMVQTMSGRRYG
jgi:hypothetical protein